MRKLLVIDLDQTIIDSSIRENYCYSESGELDIPKYRLVKTCPNAGIINDQLTPFGEWLKTNYFSLLEDDFIIIFLTARLCDGQDRKSFKQLGIDSMLSDHCLLVERGIASLYGGNEHEECSAKYKKPILWYLVNAYSTYDLTVIDDCTKVLTMAREQGFKAICARDLYHYDQQDFASLFT